MTSSRSRHRTCARSATTESSALRQRSDLLRFSSLRQWPLAAVRRLILGALLTQEALEVAGDAVRRRQLVGVGRELGGDLVERLLQALHEAIHVGVGGDGGVDLALVVLG